MHERLIIIVGAQADDGITAKSHFRDASTQYWANLRSVLKAASSDNWGTRAMVLLPQQVPGSRHFVEIRPGCNPTQQNDSHADNIIDFGGVTRRGYSAAYTPAQPLGAGNAEAGWPAGGRRGVDSITGAGGPPGDAALTSLLLDLAALPPEPEHCIAGSKGAELHPSLVDAAGRASLIPFGAFGSNAASHLFACMLSRAVQLSKSDAGAIGSGGSAKERDSLLHDLECVLPFANEPFASLFANAKSIVFAGTCLDGLLGLSILYAHLWMQAQQSKASAVANAAAAAAAAAFARQTGVTSPVLGRGKLKRAVTNTVNAASFIGTAQASAAAAATASSSSPALSKREVKVVFDCVAASAGAGTKDTILSVLSEHLGITTNATWSSLAFGSDGSAATSAAGFPASGAAQVQRSKATSGVGVMGTPRDTGMFTPLETSSSTPASTAKDRIQQLETSGDLRKVLQKSMFRAMAKGKQGFLSELSSIKQNDGGADEGASDDADGVGSTAAASSGSAVTPAAAPRPAASMASQTAPAPRTQPAYTSIEPPAAAASVTVSDSQPATPPRAPAIPDLLATAVPQTPESSSTGAATAVGAADGAALVGAGGGFSPFSPAVVVTGTEDDLTLIRSPLPLRSSALAAAVESAVTGVDSGADAAEDSAHRTGAAAAEASSDGSDGGGSGAELALLRAHQAILAASPAPLAPASNPGASATPSQASLPAAATAQQSRVPVTATGKPKKEGKVPLAVLSRLAASDPALAHKVAYSHDLHKRLVQCKGDVGMLLETAREERETYDAAALAASQALAPSAPATALLANVPGPAAAQNAAHRSFPTRVRRMSSAPNVIAGTSDLDGIAEALEREARVHAHSHHGNNQNGHSTGADDAGDALGHGHHHHHHNRSFQIDGGSHPHSQSASLLGVPARSSSVSLATGTASTSVGGALRVSSTSANSCVRAIDQNIEACPCGASAVLLAASRGYTDVLCVLLQSAKNSDDDDDSAGGGDEMFIGLPVRSAASMGLPSCRSFDCVSRPDRPVPPGPGPSLPAPKLIAGPTSASSSQSKSIRGVDCSTHGLRMTPLMWACARGSAESVEAILSALEETAPCPCKLIRALLLKSATGADALSFACAASAAQASSAPGSIQELLFASLDRAVAKLCSRIAVAQPPVDCVCGSAAMPHHASQLNAAHWLLSVMDHKTVALLRLVHHTTPAASGLLKLYAPSHSSGSQGVQSMSMSPVPASAAAGGGVGAGGTHWSRLAAPSIALERGVSIGMNADGDGEDKEAQQQQISLSLAASVPTSTDNGGALEFDVQRQSQRSGIPLNTSSWSGSHSSSSAAPLHGLNMFVVPPIEICARRWTLKQVLQLPQVCAPLADGAANGEIDRPSLSDTLHRCLQLAVWNGSWESAAASLAVLHTLKLPLRDPFAFETHHHSSSTSSDRRPGSSLAGQPGPPQRPGQPLLANHHRHLSTVPGGGHRLSSAHGHAHGEAAVPVHLLDLAVQRWDVKMVSQLLAYRHPAVAANASPAVASGMAAVSQSGVSAHRSASIPGFETCSFHPSPRVSASIRFLIMAYRLCLMGPPFTGAAAAGAGGGIGGGGNGINNSKRNGAGLQPASSTLLGSNASATAATQLQTAIVNCLSPRTGAAGHGIGVGSGSSNGAGGSFGDVGKRALLIASEVLGTLRPIRSVHQRHHHRDDDEDELEGSSDSSNNSDGESESGSDDDAEAGSARDLQQHHMQQLAGTLLYNSSGSADVPWLSSEGVVAPSQRKAFSRALLLAVADTLRHLRPSHSLPSSLTLAGTAGSMGSSRGSDCCSNLMRVSMPHPVTGKQVFSLPMMLVFYCRTCEKEVCAVCADRCHSTNNAWVCGSCGFDTTPASTIAGSGGADYRHHPRAARHGDVDSYLESHHSRSGQGSSKHGYYSADVSVAGSIHGRSHPRSRGHSHRDDEASIESFDHLHHMHRDASRTGAQLHFNSAAAAGSGQPSRESAGSAPGFGVHSSQLLAPAMLNRPGPPMLPGSSTATAGAIRPGVLSAGGSGSAGVAVGRLAQPQQFQAVKRPPGLLAGSANDRIGGPGKGFKHHPHHDVICVGLKPFFRCACEDGSGCCKALSPWASTERERAGLRYRPSIYRQEALDRKYPRPVDITDAQHSTGSPSDGPAKTGGGVIKAASAAALKATGTLDDAVLPSIVRRASLHRSQTGFVSSSSTSGSATISGLDLPSKSTTPGGGSNGQPSLPLLAQLSQSMSSIPISGAATTTAGLTLGAKPAPAVSIADLHPGLVKIMAKTYHVAWWMRRASERWEYSSSASASACPSSSAAGGGSKHSRELCAWQRLPAPTQDAYIGRMVRLLQTLRMQGYGIAWSVTQDAARRYTEIESKHRRSLPPGYDPHSSTFDINTIALPKPEDKHLLQALASQPWVDEVVVPAVAEMLHDAWVHAVMHGSGPGSNAAGAGAGTGAAARKHRVDGNSPTAAATGPKLRSPPPAKHVTSTGAASSADASGAGTARGIIDSGDSAGDFSVGLDQLGPASAPPQHHAPPAAHAGSSSGGGSASSAHQRQYWPDHPEPINRLLVPFAHLTTREAAPSRSAAEAVVHLLVYLGIHITPPGHARKPTSATASGSAAAGRASGGPASAAAAEPKPALLSSHAPSKIRNLGPAGLDHLLATRAARGVGAADSPQHSHGAAGAAGGQDSPSSSAASPIPMSAFLQGQINGNHAASASATVSTNVTAASQAAVSSLNTYSRSILVAVLSAGITCDDPAVVRSSVVKIQSITGQSVPHNPLPSMAQQLAVSMGLAPAPASQQQRRLSSGTGLPLNGPMASPQQQQQGHARRPLSILSPVKVPPGATMIAGGFASPTASSSAGPSSSSSSSGVSGPTFTISSPMRSAAPMAPLVNRSLLEAIQVGPKRESPLLCAIRMRRSRAANVLLDLLRVHPATGAAPNAASGGLAASNRPQSLRRNAGLAGLAAASSQPPSAAGFGEEHSLPALPPAVYLNQTKPQSPLPLSLASYLGLHRICERLLSMGAAPTSEDRSFSAVGKVFDMLQRSKTSSGGEGGRSAGGGSSSAAASSRFDLDPNKTTLMPIHYAALGGHSRIVRMYIRWKHEVESNSSGSSSSAASATALHSAAAVAAATAAGVSGLMSSRSMHSSFMSRSTRDGGNGGMMSNGSLLTSSSSLHQQHKDEKEIRRAAASAHESWSRARVLALSIAVHRGHLSVVRAVLACGAEPLASDGFKSSPYYRCLLLVDGDVDNLADISSPHSHLVTRNGRSAGDGRNGHIDGSSDEDDEDDGDGAAAAQRRRRRTGGKTGATRTSDSESLASHGTADTRRHRPGGKHDHSKSSASSAASDADPASDFGKHSLSKRSAVAGALFAPSASAASTGGRAFDLSTLPSIVSILSETPTVRNMLRWYAASVAFTLLVTQIGFVILFVYASPANPRFPTTAYGLYKQYVEGAVSTSLQASVKDACGWYGWLASSLCQDGDDTCLGRLAGIQPAVGCNVSTAMLAAAGSGPSLLSYAVHRSPPYDSTLVLGSSIAVGAMRLTTYSLDALSGSGSSIGGGGSGAACIPWEANSFSVLPDGSQQLMPVYASSSCPSFAATTSKEMFPPGDPQWSAPVPEADDRGVGLYPSAYLDAADGSWVSSGGSQANSAASSGTGTDGLAILATSDSTSFKWRSFPISSNAAQSGYNITGALGAIFDGGDAAITSIVASRLEFTLHQPSLSALTAVRIDAVFPPFGTASTTVSTRIAQVDGVPSSLTGFAAQIAMLLIFLTNSLNLATAFCSCAGGRRFRSGSNGSGGGSSGGSSGGKINSSSGSGSFYGRTSLTGGNRSSGSSSGQMRWRVIDAIVPILILAILLTRIAAWVRFDLSPSWSPSQVGSNRFIDSWSLLGSVQVDTDLSAVVLLLAIFRMIEYLERAPLQIGVTLQSIINTWLDSRTLIYLIIMLALTGTLAIAYNVAFSLSSSAFVTVPQSFYSLFTVGFFNQPFSFTTPDARPVITLFQLLWPVTFLVFINGYIAVISDVYKEHETKAKSEWRKAVVSQLQEALRWGEEPRTKALRSQTWRVLTAGYRRTCGRDGGGGSGGSRKGGCGKVKGWARAVFAFVVGKARAKRIAASLSAVTARGAGAAALTLAILFVMRPAISVLFSVQACCRRSGRARGGGSSSASVGAPNASSSATNPSHQHQQQVPPSAAGARPASLSRMLSLTLSAQGLPLTAAGSNAGTSAGGGLHSHGSSASPPHDLQQQQQSGEASARPAADGILELEAVLKCMALEAAPVVG